MGRLVWLTCRVWGWRAARVWATLRLWDAIWWRAVAIGQYEGLRWLNRVVRGDRVPSWREVVRRAREKELTYAKDES